jgi:vitamin B12/bleomycin/antimicrobial peptide transport system ATP-binding/permease protein
MNLWNRAIFDALEKKDVNAVMFLSMLYFAILAASVTVSVAQVYSRMTIQRPPLRRGFRKQEPI